MNICTDDLDKSSMGINSLIQEGGCLQASNPLEERRLAPMLHIGYHKHLRECFLCFYSSDEFWKTLGAHAKELTIIATLNLDPAADLLRTLYSPVHLDRSRDPVEMLRSLLLMTAVREPSITRWVERTRSSSVFAIMAGFTPDDTPGSGHLL